MSNLDSENQEEKEIKLAVEDQPSPEDTKWCPNIAQSSNLSNSEDSQDLPAVANDKGKEPATGDHAIKNTAANDKGKHDDHYDLQIIKNTAVNDKGKQAAADDHHDHDDQIIKNTAANDKGKQAATDDHDDHVQISMNTASSSSSASASSSSSGPSTKEMANDEVDEDDDGFKTPTSLEHRIPPATVCPPSPRKKVEYVFPNNIPPRVITRHRILAWRT